MGGAGYVCAVKYPGHVTLLANSTGAMADTYRYDPGGQAEAASEAVYQPLRDMARELDRPTGLYHVRNRWYDPQMLRFISEHLIGLGGSSDELLRTMDDLILTARRLAARITEPLGDSFPLSGYHRSGSRKFVPQHVGRCMPLGRGGL